jgi:hypothetical protein
LNGKFRAILVHSEKKAMPKGKRFAHNAPPLQEIGRWLRYICS